MRLARSVPESGALAAVAHGVAFAFLGLAAAGCAGDAAEEASSMTIGSAELSLSLPNSSNITSVGYKITHSKGYSSDGSVPVADSQAITFQIGNIPARLGYEIKLGAKTSSGDTCIAGPMPFDVTAGQTALVAMTLRCGSGSGGPSNSGNVRVDVDVQTGDNCPSVDGLTALPRSTKVGGTIDLRGYATSKGAKYAWSVAPATGGTFSADDKAKTTFTCSAAGTHQVTLSVVGGGSCTPSTADIPLICTDGNTAGSGGAGVSGTGASGAGAGGAGAGGAGAGGAGAGGAGAGGAGAGGAGAGGAGAGGAGAGGAGAGGAGAGGAGAGGAGAGGAGAGGAGAGGAAAGAGGSGSAACMTCRNTACRDYQGSGLDLVSGCLTAINTSLGAMASDPTFLQNCMDVLSCAKANNCAYGVNGASDCYCGSATPDACINTGPAADAKCIPQVQAAARATANADVTIRFSDLAYPMGWAYFLLECDRDNCLTSCGPGT